MSVGFSMTWIRYRHICMMLDELERACKNYSYTSCFSSDDIASDFWKSLIARTCNDIDSAIRDTMDSDEFRDVED